MKFCAVYFLAVVAFKYVSSAITTVPVNLINKRVALELDNVTEIDTNLQLSTSDVPGQSNTVNFNGNITFETIIHQTLKCKDEGKNTSKAEVVPKLPMVPPGYSIIAEDDAYVTAIKVHTIEQTWNEARKTCFREKGFLAYATSKEELDLYLQKMKDVKVDDIWLGLHDLFETGDFSTVLGEIACGVAYYKWRQGQPDNYLGKEHCVHLYDTGRSNDIPCTTERSFICKIKLPLL